MNGAIPGPSPVPVPQSPVNGNSQTAQAAAMKSPIVRVVTANVGSLPRDNIIAKHPEIIEKIISVAGYPALILLQETNWTSDSLMLAQNLISRKTRKKGKRFALIGSASASRASGSRGVGLVYSSEVEIIRSNTTFPPRFEALENRLLRADVLIKGTDVLLTVLVIYAPVYTSNGPSTNSAAFYAALDEYLGEVPAEHPIIAGGDWNAVPSGKTPPLPIDIFLSTWDLEDAYTTIKNRGSSINYTTTNKHGTTCRRLDRLHFASGLRDHIRSTKALEDPDGPNLTKSTHQAIQFDFRFGPKAGRQLRGLGVWRMPYWILDDDYRDWLLIRVAMILDGLTRLPPQVALVQLKAALKAVISEEARERVFRLSRMSLLERKQRALEATAKQWHRFPSFESPEQIKCRVKSMQKQDELRALTQPDGTVVRGTEDILNITADYYEGLLSRVPKTNETMEGNFLDIFPSEDRLDSLQQEVLDLDFSKEEVLEVIQRVAKKKSAPGPDGIPYKFYLVCWEPLGELLTAVYNEPATGEPILTERNTSVIRLIFKSGNPADISNYRPIALMNTEVKIYTHLINGRLRPLLDDLIHPSQSGFVPGRLMSDNLDVMDHFYNRYSDQQKGWMVGSLDFKKAYDTVSQDWVRKCLANVGIPTKMIQRVAAVQQSAVSRVNVRGFLTRPIKIRLGVRQGCPLSPSLFILSVDCLIRRMEQQMRGLVSFIPTPFEKTCRTNSHTHTGAQHPPPGPTDILLDAKVLAYADDIVVFMSCNNDLQVVGEALVDFQLVSGLALSPPKTVLQRVGGRKIKMRLAGDCFPSSMFQYKGTPDPPTPVLFEGNDIDMDFVRQYWPKDPATGNTPTLLDRDEIFRYLGIYFGGARSLEEHYRQWQQDMKDDLAKKSLWGLPVYSQACLLNIYFFSRLNFQIPYVMEADDSFLRDLVAKACDRINQRRRLPNGRWTRRRYADELITASIEQGGFNLRNLIRFGDSLRAVRALRFFNRGTAALKDAAFQFYSDSDWYQHEWPCDRLHGHVIINSHLWSRYLSPTMFRCLTSLKNANKPLEGEIIRPSVPPEPTEDSDPYYIWDYTQAVERAEIASLMRLQIARFRGQRHVNPIRHLDEAELDHLEWGTGYRTAKELMAQWRTLKKFRCDRSAPILFARPKTWEAMGIFPESMEGFYTTIMGKMRSHYLKNAYQANILHHLRIGRLTVIRGNLSDSYAMRWRQPGCGICHNTSTVHLHSHIFCDCPVMKAMLLKLGIQPVESLGEWVFGEEPLCRRKSKSKDEEKQEQDRQERLIRGNYYRELAYGIWTLERKLRETGEDANQAAIQDKFSFMLKRAQSCFLRVKEYETSEISESQQTEMVRLWEEESGQGGRGPTGAE